MVVTYTPIWCCVILWWFVWRSITIKILESLMRCRKAYCQRIRCLNHVMLYYLMACHAVIYLVIDHESGNTNKLPTLLSVKWAWWDTKWCGESAVSPFPNITNTTVSPIPISMIDIWMVCFFHILVSWCRMCSCPIGFVSNFRIGR